ncbi:MAG: hypothetical protein C4324_07230 [Blastocatellia bacterium]
MSGCEISEVSRRGKYLLIGLSCRKMLVIHLRMTGGFALISQSDALPRHTHLVLALSGRKILVFSDQRHFARAYLVSSDEFSQIPTFAKLAPEPFPETFRFREFTEKLQGVPATDQGFSA